MRRLRYVIALLVATAALCTAWAWNRWFTPDHAAEAGLEMVEWKTAEPRAASGEWILVDARSERKFAGGHLPGAFSLPADAPAEYLEFAAAEWPRGCVVVVYCGSPSCSLAAELAKRLRDELGLDRVRVLTGNYFKDLRRPGNDNPEPSAQDREEKAAH